MDDEHAEDVELVAEERRMNDALREAVGEPREGFAWKTSREVCRCGRGCPTVVMLCVDLGRGVEVQMDDVEVALFVPHAVARPAVTEETLDRLHTATAAVWGDAGSGTFCDALLQLRDQPEGEAVINWLARRPS